MKLFNKTILSLGIVGLLSSCLTETDKANIEKVDLLIADTQEQLASLEATDYESIVVHHDTLFSNLRLLSMHLEDTVDRNLLIILSDYRSLRKVYAKYKSNSPAYPLLAWLLLSLPGSAKLSSMEENPVKTL